MTKLKIPGYDNAGVGKNQKEKQSNSNGLNFSGIK
jgi:hypothetical protein